MALSQTFHDTNGTTEEWDISLSGGYLSRDHVKAYFYPTGNLEDARAPKTFTWLTDTRIRITPALAAGGKLLIQRETPRADLLVEFTNTADFTQQNLTTLGKQSLFMVQEVTDLYEDPELIGAIADAKQAAADATAAAATTNSNVVAAQAAEAAAEAAQASTELAADAALAASEAADSSQAAAAGSASSAATALASANAASTAAQAARDAILNSPVIALGSGTTLDLAAGKAFTKAVDGDTTFSVSGVAASPKLNAILLDLTFSTSAVITWWSGVKWSYGLAPSFNAAGRTTLAFVSFDGGTTWVGSVVAKDLA